VLRREGLYSSNIAVWRRARTPVRWPGSARHRADPQQQRITHLQQQQQNRQLEQELAKPRFVADIQTRPLARLKTISESANAEHESTPRSPYTHPAPECRRCPRRPATGATHPVPPRPGRHPSPGWLSSFLNEWWPCRDQAKLAGSEHAWLTARQSLTDLQTRLHSALTALVNNNQGP
jgi:hypothetical protein